jgi:hypothetical protein
MAETQYRDLFRLLQSDGWDSMEQGTRERSWWKLKATLPSGRRIEVNFSAESALCRFELTVAHISPARSCIRALSCFLLEINHQVRLVRFSIDWRGYVHMSADLASDWVSPDSVRMVLSAMKAYFQQYHEEVQLLARHEAAARLKDEILDEALGEELVIR